jgi:hypothetical protein
LCVGQVHPSHIFGQIQIAGRACNYLNTRTSDSLRVRTADLCLPPICYRIVPPDMPRVGRRPRGVSHWTPLRMPSSILCFSNRCRVQPGVANSWWRRSGRCRLTSPTLVEHSSAPIQTLFPPNALWLQICLCAHVTCMNSFSLLQMKHPAMEERWCYHSHMRLSQLTATNSHDLFCHHDGE